MAATTTTTLTTDSLSIFTQHHPPNPHNTVHTYLQDQKHRHYPPIPLSPPSSRPLRPRSPSISPTRFDKPHERDKPNPETALVLVADRGALKPVGDSTNSFNWRTSEKKAVEKDEREKGKGKEDLPPQVEKVRKPSVVSALKPRVKSSAVMDSLGEVEKEKKVLMHVLGEDRGREGSPMLLARVDQRKKEKEMEEAERAQEETKARDKAKARSSPEEKKKITPSENRPSTSKAKSSAPPPLTKEETNKEKILVRQRELAKEKRSRAADWDSEEDAEHMERLEARRQRRLKKALVVKDKTVSARATGLAAAEGLSKAKKEKKKHKKEKEKAESDVTSDESSEDEDVDKRKKEKRKSVTERARAAVQATQKPSNVGRARLTIRPNIQLGLFNKGQASARTAVAKQSRQPVPDLAFSELTFLNATRPSPPPSSSSSSSTSSSSSASSSPKTKTHPTRNSTLKKVSVTYGSKSKPSKEGLETKSKKIEPSKYFAKPSPEVLVEEPKKKKKKNSSSVFEGVGIPSIAKYKSSRKHSEPGPSPPSPIHRKKSLRSPPPQSVNMENSSSGHSEFSRRKARKEKIEHAVDGGREEEGEDTQSHADTTHQPEQVMDTTHAWQRLPQHPIHPIVTRAAPPPPPQPSSRRSSRRSRLPIAFSSSHHHPFPSLSQDDKEAPSVEAIDRLIQACRDERLEASPPRQEFFQPPLDRSPTLISFGNDVEDQQLEQGRQSEDVSVQNSATPSFLDELQGKEVEDYAYDVQRDEVEDNEYDDRQCEDAAFQENFGPERFGETVDESFEDAEMVYEEDQVPRTFNEPQLFQQEGSYDGNEGDIESSGGEQRWVDVTSQGGRQDGGVDLFDEFGSGVGGDRSDEDGLYLDYDLHQQRRLGGNAMDPEMAKAMKDHWYRVQP